MKAAMNTFAHVLTQPGAATDCAATEVQLGRPWCAVNEGADMLDTVLPAKILKCQPGCMRVCHESVSLIGRVGTADWLRYPILTTFTLVM